MSRANFIENALDDLDSTGYLALMNEELLSKFTKKPTTRGSTVTVKFDATLMAGLNRFCLDTHLSRSEAMRRIVHYFLADVYEKEDVEA